MKTKFPARFYSVWILRYVDLPTKEWKRFLGSTRPSGSGIELRQG